ncbi:flagellar export protein FliJ [Thalassorhabdus alkalitolerans]|uniref:Flagellar FliJ protein n=1 Tax=Thalassorhabdus alkalitolerans TaxID=2282697 RepID=A0ABW0YK91_9BACI
MSFQFSLKKLLEMKENARVSAEEEYSRSVTKFEEKATHLYHLLKRKEEAEAFYGEKMKHGMPIHELQTAESSLMLLHQDVMKAKVSADHARVLMNSKKNEMQYAFIEYKKYERIREQKRREYEYGLKKEEEKIMDEISIQKYAAR